MNYQKYCWLESNDLNSSGYWDSKSNEKGKVFDVSDGDFERLNDSKQLRDIYEQLCFLLNYKGISVADKSILSLASGTCWLEGRLLAENGGSLTAVDFSRHRIHELAPLTLNHYRIDEANACLVYGSMLDLGRIPARSQDVVLLSQAFHHTDEPARLLREIKRVLAENGTVLIVGEHYFDIWIRLKLVIKHFIKFFVRGRDYRLLHGFIPNYQSLFPRSFEKGDMHYPMIEYHSLFVGCGFSYQHFVNQSRNLQSFILTSDH